MRSFKFILLFVLLLAVSCQKERAYVEQSTGLSSIVLKLDSSTAMRMETKTPTDLQEGLQFENLLVILTDNTHKVVGKVTKTYTTPYPENDLIEFDDLLPGNYTAYAYANYDSEDWQDDTVADEEYTVTVGAEDYDNDYLNRELLTLTGTNAPKDPTASPAASAMLLTGKLDIALGLTTAEKTLYLTRPVVRFKVTVHNNTPFSVTVDDLSFSHFNPDRAYLLDHSSNGVPGIPDGVTYRELPAYNSSSPATVAANDTNIVYSTLLYENASPNTYKVFASLTLNRSLVDANLEDLEMSLGGGGFGAQPAGILNNMDVNEYVEVLVINPQVNKRYGRLYAYVSSEGKMAWESAGYPNYVNIFNRAKAIYKQVASYDYGVDGYTSSNGYSHWYGLAGNPADFSTTFDYSGARSTHFRRLTKQANGLFTLDGLGVGNPPASSTISNLQIIKGNRNNNSKIAAGTEDYLVKLKDPSTGKILVSQTSSGNGAEAYLVFDTESLNQDRQFLLFANYSPGAALNRMLKENNKSVPLTYMSRNEEVNVIINVYYADQAGTLNFVVDNSTWTSPTEASHIFN